MPRWYTPSHDGGRSWSSATIALLAVAGVLVIGGVAGAVTLARGSHDVARGAAQVAPRGWTVPGTASFTAVANVTPPVAVAGCTAPSTFTYAGTLSVTVPGTVRYQWVYSSGQPGPVQTVTFTAAGHRPVTSAVVGTPYSGSLGVTGQTSGLTVTYAITSGSLPPGLSLDQATGAVTGTPTQTGRFFAYIVVTDVATGATKQGGADVTVYAAGTVI